MLDFENYDFSLGMFRQLCMSIAENYQTLTIAEYLEKQSPARFIIMRHDVDRMPRNALRTAEIEQELGIKATYYFRAIKSVFIPEIIKQIEDMGHDIGYHYECLSEAKGNHEIAIKLFQSNLERFRKISDVKTICMHGRPLSKYDNRALWEFGNFEDFGIIGEAYLSLNEGLNYITDTGRSWCSRNNMRDFIPGKDQQIYVNNTAELIELIESNKLQNLYILSHPERWSSSISEWYLYYLIDCVFNLGKKILKQLNWETDQYMK